MRISDWSSDVCSSDLNAAAAQLVEVEDLLRVAIECALAGIFPVVVLSPDAAATAIRRHAGFGRHAGADEEHDGRRSEEHTSELQSLMRISYAVFCLKKKKSHNTKQNQTDYK